MNRTSINPPNDWGAIYEMNQAEVVRGLTRYLHFSGQTALKTDPDAEFGVSVVNPNDQEAQLDYILNSIDELLEIAGMTRAHIIHVKFYTTDMEGMLKCYDKYAVWIKAAGIMPTQSMIGVQ